MSGGKATAVRVPTPGKNLGKFHCGHFNLFDSVEAAAYAALRQLDSDSSSGIEIAFMREFIKKTREEEYEDGERVSAKEEEEPHVYIEWWEKQVKRKKGDNYGEQKDAKQGWA